MEWNKADFGDGAPITATIDVATDADLSDLLDLLRDIKDKTGVKNYVFNLKTDIALPSSFYIPFQCDKATADFTFSLRGNGHKITADDAIIEAYSDKGGDLRLILRDITLKGHSSNTEPLVNLNGLGVKLIMKKGAKITGNTSDASGSGTNGGGVIVMNTAEFDMEDGEISGNTSPYGGGVYVKQATFRKTGGIIKDNTATGGSSGFGHQVFVSDSPDRYIDA